MYSSIQAKFKTSIILISLGLVCFAFSPTPRATGLDEANMSDDVYALGLLMAGTGTQATSIASPDCAVWEVVPSPNAGTQNDHLTSLTATSANDVWAAGWYFAGGNTTLTVSEHWNGTSWSVVSSPNVDDDSYLYGITAVASDNVWAVGSSWKNGGNPPGKTLVLHWNGGNWSVIPSPSAGAYDSRLYEVRAVSANDVSAVGYSSDCFNCPGHTLTEHWNGVNWSVVPSPNPGLSSGLTGIAAVSANQVWAAGDYVPCGGCRKSTLTMRWNGTIWTVVSSPNAGSGDNHINRMSAVPSSNQIWAVGSYYLQGNTGAYRTLALYWNGSQWSIVPTPNSQAGNSGFSGVAARSTQDVWAVGITNEVGDVCQSLVQHWNGTSWTVSPSQSPGAGRNELGYVAVTPTGNWWAVGQYFNTPYNYRTLAEQLDYTCGAK